VTLKLDGRMAQKEKIVYKLQDLVDILGVSVRTLRKYIKRGELRAVKIGRNYLVRPQDLDDFLEANIFTPPKKNSTELLQELMEDVPPKLPDLPKLVVGQKTKSKKR
jgi:excisionase family DNA binding protein